MTGARHPLRFRRSPALLVAAAALAGACAEVGTDPSTPTSIRFDRLPSPSIEEGDTLRDSTGRPVPLRELVTVYNGSGGVIANAPLTVTFPDTGAALFVTDDSAYVMARAGIQRASYRLQVRSGNLQPPPLAIAVVRSPARVVPASDSVASAVRGTTGPQTYTTLAARVERDSLDVAADTLVALGVPSYLVRFEVAGAAARVLDSVGVPTGTGTSARLRAVTWDTTDASGLAAPTLRLYFDEAAASGLVDTVRVWARIRSRGVLLDSALLRLEVRTSPPAEAGARR